MSRHIINKERTQLDIEQEFLKSYSMKGIDGVRISSICKELSISRSTFYSYFNDKYDILETVETRILEDLWAINSKLPTLNSQHLIAKALAENTLKTMHYIRKHQDWLHALLGPKGDPSFVHRWKADIMRSFQDKTVEPLKPSNSLKSRGFIYASTMMGIYSHAIIENPDVSDEDIAHIMERVLYILAQDLLDWA